MRHRTKGAIRFTQCPAAVAIALVLWSGGVCPAQQEFRRGPDIGGFGELRWGTSPDEARKIYDDLSFGRYAIVDSAEEPARVYLRKQETAKIDSVAFDSVEYWFRGDRFYKVRAVMHSRIGPRSLQTRAEHAYDRLWADLTGRYGKPRKYEVNYVTEFLAVMKDATWEIDHSSIRLKYEGPKEGNEDLLTYEMRKGGS